MLTMSMTRFIMLVAFCQLQNTGGAKIQQNLRICDSDTNSCEVQAPRTYKQLGNGVAVLEGNDIARVVPCNTECCKKECDADMNCFSFSSRLDFCMLKDRCITPNQTVITSPYKTYYVEDCSGKQTEDSNTEQVKDTGAKVRHNMRYPTVGGPATRRHRTTVNIETARQELGLKAKDAYDSSTPKKLIIGNVWEQLGEGTKSLTEAMVLANATGRQFVLPYVANPNNISNTGSLKFDASVFQSKKVNTWGNNFDFSSIFEVDEFRKCFPDLTIHDTLEDANVGQDVVGIFFNYPNAKQLPFAKKLKKTQSGILDCTEYAFETEFHKYSFKQQMPTMNKILCLDNDLRRRYTTRGLFEELLGGYNTLYLFNWRGTRLAPHRVRLPDTFDADPWGPLTYAGYCVSDGRHVFSKDLNRLADDFVNKMTLQQAFKTSASGGNSDEKCEEEHAVSNFDQTSGNKDYMVIHLRLEKAQKAAGMHDGTLLPRFVQSIRNIQRHMSIQAGLPPGGLVPIYLATDSQKSLTFDVKRGLDKGQVFSDGVRNQLNTFTFDCPAHGHWDNSVACAVIELLIMARSKHLVQVGASSFTKWGTEMMNVSSTTRMGNKGQQGVCIYQTKAKNTIKFGQVYADLVYPITFCEE